MLSDSVSKTLALLLWQRLRPPPSLTVAEWANEYRYLSSEASAEPGKWRNKKAPHTVAPMEAMSPADHCQLVVCMWSSQTGKTEVINNSVGYYMDLVPCPILVVQPTQEPMAKAWSKDRLRPMIRDTPALSKKINPASGKGGNTTFHVQFPGGQVSIGGANSPSQLASRPIRVFIGDEVDRWDVTKEGDAWALGSKRTISFKHQKKLLAVSSPTFDDVGIHYLYHTCEQQHVWQLPCLHCGESQRPVFEHFVCETNARGRITELHYSCEHCGATMPERDEYRVKRKGFWHCAVNDGNASKGYWFNQFSSPFATWRESCQEMLDAQNDDARLQTKFNTVQADTWKEHAEELDWEALYKRRELYPQDDNGEWLLPEKICLLMMLVDTQDSWLDAEVVGITPDREIYAIEKLSLHGQTDRPEPWEALDRAFQKKYRHPNGGMLGISHGAIDMRGHRQKIVKAWVGQRRPAWRLFQGVNKGASAMLKKGKQKMDDGTQRRIDVWSIRVDDYKRQVMQSFHRTEPGIGRCHWPCAHDGGSALGYDQEIFEQLCAERQTIKRVRGFEVRDWEKRRARNEAFDLRVYAAALLDIVNPDFEQLALALKPAAERQKAESPPTPSRSRSRGGWFSRYRR